MSRIGKSPIPIPEGVKVSLNGNSITVEGPKGKLSMDIHPDMRVEIDDSEKVIRVFRPTERSMHKALHGTTAALIRNMVKGVSEGFTVVLELHGLGYRASMKGNNLELSLGKSHQDIYPVPEGIKIEVKGNEIHISGIDKQKVGQVAAEIRALRKPDPYKGKGIRYKDEVIKLKPGKAAGKK
jgi:large subunit ribosomal protein L6